VGRRLLDALTNDLLLKLTALGLAFLLWTTVKTPDSVAIDGIPVDTVVRDAGWTLVGEAEPAAVTIEFSGPLRQLVRVATERPPIIVTVDEVTDTVETVQLRSTQLSLGAGMEDIRVETIRPIMVRLRFDRITSRRVPVAVRVVGDAAEGYESTGPVLLDPAVVRVTGPRHVIEQIDSLRLGPIELTQRTVTDTLTLGIDNLPANVTVDPLEIRAVLPVGRVKTDPGRRTGARGGGPVPAVAVAGQAGNGRAGGRTAGGAGGRAGRERAGERP